MANMPTQKEERRPTRACMSVKTFLFVVHVTAFRCGLFDSMDSCPVASHIIVIANPYKTSFSPVTLDIRFA